MFWPSFNTILVDHRYPGRKLEAVCSTYLALAVSAVTAAAVSVLSNPKGKLNPVCQSFNAEIIICVRLICLRVNIGTSERMIGHFWIILLLSSLPIRSFCSHASLPVVLLLEFPCQWFISHGRQWQSDSLPLLYQPLDFDTSRFFWPHKDLFPWFNNLLQLPIISHLAGPHAAGFSVPWHLCCSERTWTPRSTRMAGTPPPAD